MSRTKNGGLRSMTAVILLASQLVTAAYSAPENLAHPDERAFDGHTRVLNGRYNHGHFYPPLGASVKVLPERYHPYFLGGRSFYFSGGVWYAPGGLGFVVVRPPAGLVVSVLPPDYSTVWIGGLPYYYANDVYYTWNTAQSGYVVVDPPANADHPSGAPNEGHDDLIIYQMDRPATSKPRIATSAIAGQNRKRSSIRCCRAVVYPQTKRTRRAALISGRCRRVLEGAGTSLGNRRYILRRLVNADSTSLPHAHSLDQTQALLLFSNLGAIRLAVAE